MTQPLGTPADPINPQHYQGFSNGAEVEGTQTPTIKKRAECSIEDCFAPRTARGYCQKHYMRVLRHGDPNPLGLPVALSERFNSNGERKCSSCKRYLSLTHFAKAGKNIPDRLQIYCRECTKLKRLHQIYGLSADSLRYLMHAQKMECKICSIPFSEENQFVVDHDHDCCPTKKTCGKCVRGILCISCNVRLGIMEDKTWVEQASKYLMENPLGASDDDAPTAERANRGGVVDE